MADNEKITSVEIGIKTELDRKLRLNVDGYIYQVDGQQLTAVGGQYNTATLLNADKTEGLRLRDRHRLGALADWLFTLGAATTTPRSTTRT